MKDKFAINEYITGKDLKRLREMLRMTQEEFADFVNSAGSTVENWERKDGVIKGPIVTLLEILIRKPQLVDWLRLPERKMKLRIWYMYENTVCTVIDVDEINRMVKIKNYTDNVLERAFGVNTEPTFEDYEEFLKTRCFPETRDMLKLELKKLDIPFYDPIMIIERTEGRMADDKFWLRIER